MEQEGIYYYFRHADGQAHAGADRLDGQARAGARVRDADLIRARAERAAGVRARQQLGLRRARSSPACTCTTTTTSSGRASSCRTKKVLSRGVQPERLRGLRLPGRVPPERRWRPVRGVRIDEFGAQFELAQRGHQRARASRVGSLFTLEQYPRDDQNREHLVVVAQLRPGVQRLRRHAGERRARSTAAASRRCRSSQQFRPRRLTPKPFVQGPQTAVVVGPGGRGDLHRQVRPGEGAVPLGPRRQEGREQLLLDPRVAPLGRQELGRGARRRASARR